MADHSLGALLRRLQQHQLPAPPGEGLADADLLRLFAAHRDGRAFELLLWRHGPMVLATCRRLLRHEQDAEDAFQATFLVLARKAGSVARGQALAGWLHRVACRVALRACRARRDTVPLGEVIAPENNAPLWSELRGVLDEEVGRLPARYREPFVLCHFQGKTHAEAARELGCPPGTIASRLHWARQRLRARLAGRGVAFPATALSALSAGTAGATESACVARAVRSTLAFVARDAQVAPHVLAWSKGVARSMFLRNSIVFLVVASLVLAGVGVARHQLGAASRGEVIVPPESARPGPRQGAGDDRRNEAERARAGLQSLRERVEEEEQEETQRRVQRRIQAEETEDRLRQKEQELAALRADLLLPTRKKISQTRLTLKTVRDAPQQLRLLEEELKELRAEEEGLVKEVSILRKLWIGVDEMNRQAERLLEIRRESRRRRLEAAEERLRRAEDRAEPEAESDSRRLRELDRKLDRVLEELAELRRRKPAR